MIGCKYAIAAAYSVDARAIILERVRYEFGTYLDEAVRYRCPVSGKWDTDIPRNMTILELIRANHPEIILTDKLIRRANAIDGKIREIVNNLGPAKNMVYDIWSERHTISASVSLNIYEIRYRELLK